MCFQIRDNMPIAKRFAHAWVLSNGFHRSRTGFCFSVCQKLRSRFSSWYTWYRNKGQGVAPFSAFFNKTRTFSGTGTCNCCCTPQRSKKEWAGSSTHQSPIVSVCNVEFCVTNGKYLHFSSPPTRLSVDSAPTIGLLGASQKFIKLAGNKASETAQFFPGNLLILC